VDRGGLDTPICPAGRVTRETLHRIPACITMHGRRPAKLPDVCRDPPARDVSLTAAYRLPWGRHHSAQNSVGGNECPAPSRRDHEPHAPDVRSRADPRVLRGRTQSSFSACEPYGLTPSRAEEVGDSMGCPVCPVSGELGMPDFVSLTSYDWATIFDPSTWPQGSWGRLEQGGSGGPRGRQRPVLPLPAPVMSTHGVGDCATPGQVPPLCDVRGDHEPAAAAARRQRAVGAG
jgi:hypothetical protein